MFPMMNVRADDGKEMVCYTPWVSVEEHSQIDMTNSTQLAVIGGGPGGYAAAFLAADLGMQVTLIDEAPDPGGVCLYRGCMPSKALLHVAKLLTEAREARAWGVEFGEPTIDIDRLRAWKDGIVGKLTGGLGQLSGQRGVAYRRGRAELVGPTAARVTAPEGGTTDLQFEHAILATGSRPASPRGLSLESDRVWDSTRALDVPGVPRSLLVVGGGYIAVEFAGVFAGLGVETTLVYRGETVLRGFDDDVRVHVHEELQRKGVRVITQTIFSEVEKLPNGRLNVKMKNGMHVETDVLMGAMGRVPAVEGLGLEKVGVKQAANGAIIVDEYSKTNIDTIWAVGDVTDRVNLTPVAIREGQAFSETVFEDKPNFFDYENIPTAVFTQPPVGTVGMTEEEARHKFGAIDIYKTTFRPMKDILTGDEERVLMKLIIKQDDQKVIGCHIVGPDAPEIIQAVAIAVKMGATKRDFDNTCALHPSLAEELVTMREKFIPPELA